MTRENTKSVKKLSKEEKRPPLQIVQTIFGYNCSKEQLEELVSNLSVWFGRFPTSKVRINIYNKPRINKICPFSTFFKSMG